MKNLLKALLIPANPRLMDEKGLAFRLVTAHSHTRHVSMKEACLHKIGLT